MNTFQILFLELVSIIINFIFFSSSALVGKLRWHVALNIAIVKDYVTPLSPFLL
jgi:hypothetical protein